LTPCEIFLVLWGLLCGFIGWASCLRLVAPISDWLMQSDHKNPDVITGTVRLLVLLFLLTSMFLLLRLPLGMGAAGECTNDYRGSFGWTFVASGAGWVLYGLLRRGHRLKDKKRT